MVAEIRKTATTTCNRKKERKKETLLLFRCRSFAYLHAYFANVFKK